MVRAAVSLGGLRPIRRKRDYRAFARAGGISKERAQTFTRLNTTRNQLAHIYIDVHAGTAHKAVLTMLAELPGFTRDYLAWLERSGHELS
jgi:uncharacterized protein YutE (UPF0331/DUF86 family)